MYLMEDISISIIPIYWQYHTINYEICEELIDEWALRWLGSLCSSSYLLLLFFSERTAALHSREQRTLGHLWVYIGSDWII
jgi:hypothetical protein